MDTKKIIEKLLAVAEKQQKVITKLAQALPAQHMDPNVATKRDAETILNALPSTVRPAVADLAVHGSLVNVKFQPEQGTDQAFNVIVQTVQQLQNSGTLSGRNYQVKEVA